METRFVENPNEIQVEELSDQDLVLVAGGKSAQIDPNGG